MEPTKDQKINHVLLLLENMDNTDETIHLLQSAMQHYSSTWDMCEGYKHALYTTLAFQYKQQSKKKASEELDEVINILSSNL